MCPHFTQFLLLAIHLSKKEFTKLFLLTDTTLSIKEGTFKNNSNKSLYSHSLTYKYVCGGEGASMKKLTVCQKMLSAV